MIELTSFAVSADETRYNLNGVQFEPAAGELRLVAGLAVAEEAGVSCRTGSS